MPFQVKILVFLKDGVLDTQGKAVATALKNSGYSNVQDVRVGKYIELMVNASGKEEARLEATKMCDDLLVNDIIEDYSIEAEEA